MMAQYKSLKAQYKDALLFFRLGDFYEMFFEDAEIGSKELGIAPVSYTHLDVYKRQVQGFVDFSITECVFLYMIKAEEHQPPNYRLVILSPYVGGIQR